jgi:hypothetical protein
MISLSRWLIVCISVMAASSRAWTTPERSRRHEHDICGNVKLHAAIDVFVFRHTNVKRQTSWLPSDCTPWLTSSGVNSPGAMRRLS